MYAGKLPGVQDTDESVEPAGGQDLGEKNGAPVAEANGIQRLAAAFQRDFGDEPSGDLRLHAALLILFHAGHAASDAAVINLVADGAFLPGGGKAGFDIAGHDGGHRDTERSDLVGQRHGVGVDGGLAAGYVPNPFSLTITLEASSPSLTVMQSLLMAMKTNRTTYKCSVTLTIPSIKQVHFWRNGVLTNGNPVTAPKKTLDPTSWKFVFQDYYTAGFNAGV